MIRTVHPLTKGGSIAVVGHENWLIDLLRKLALDIGAHPVFAEICFPPDHSVRARCWHIEPYCGDVIDRNPRLFCEF